MNSVETGLVRPLTFGLARMHYEFGERRDFLPDFVARLQLYGAKVYLEEGYGSGMGYSQQDYLQAAQGIFLRQPKRSSRKIMCWCCAARRMSRLAR